MGSAADRRETVAAPHGWGTGRVGGISGRSQTDNCCYSPRVGDRERRWDQRQIAERQLLLPTGGGPGEEVGSAADRRETVAAPHGWGTGRGGKISGRSQRDSCCSPRVGDWERRWDQRQIVERQLLRSPRVGDWERRRDQRQIAEGQLMRSHYLQCSIVRPDSTCRPGGQYLDLGHLHHHLLLW